MIDPNYAIQRWFNHWRVHKLDQHHGSYRGWYTVKRARAGNLYCDCMRRFDCKHGLMVMEFEKEQRNANR